MRWILRIGKWLAAAVIVLALLGAVYNQVELARDAALAPPPSEMVSVNGRQIHARCEGQGAQTFLLDAGAGTWSFEWFRIQPLLAQKARVCAFDRSGMGWSEDLGGGHDGHAVALELRAIVEAAKIDRPFIYVGHSLGANFAQIYRSRFPSDVAALVLLEPGDPKDLLEDFDGTRGEAMAAPDCNWTCSAATALSHLGIARLAMMIADPGAKNLPPYIRALYRAGLSRASTLRTTVAYLNVLSKIAYQSIDAQSFGDTPVLAIVSSNPRKRESSESVAEFAAWNAAYKAHLKSLVAKSRAGVGPVEVRQATHVTMVTGERSAASVAAAILDFADTVAAGPGQAAAPDPR